MHLSAVGVRYGTRNAYLAARARLERDLRASGLPFVVARPSFVTGPARWRSLTGAALASALVRLALDPRAEGRVAHGDELR